MQPLITIFCPFTRRWAIDDWLSQLEQIDHEPGLTNLAVIIDCDEPYIANRIKQFAEYWSYRNLHTKMNENWHPNEVRLATRRQRVAEIHNQSKDLINMSDGEIIIGLEDDTVMDRVKSFNRLYQPLLDDPDTGFVEGVQVGRWGANIIGAWSADRADKPTMIGTLLPSEGYQEITGGGWYGYATRRKLWLDCEYYTSTAQPWGPDVNFGFWLSQNGYKCFIDWDTIFGHRDHTKTLYPDSPNVQLAQVVFTKNPDTGKWDRADREVTRYR